MLPGWSCCRRAAGPGSAPPWRGRCPNPYQHIAGTSIVADVRAGSALHLTGWVQPRSSFSRCLAGWPLRRAAWAAGRKARIQQGAPPSGAGTDVLTALLKPLQRLAITERECHLQARAFPHLGKVQHRVDQARAAARSDVPGLGAQRHLGGSARSFGDDHLGGGDCAASVADLDVNWPGASPG